MQLRMELQSYLIGKVQMWRLAQLVLFIFRAIMVVGMISCVVMLGILVHDKNSGNDVTTTPEGEYNHCLCGNCKQFR